MRWRIVAGTAAAIGQWDVELIHDKMYLMNPEPPIEHFEVSHGYNLLLLDRAYGDGSITWRTGLGMVVAHPMGRSAQGGGRLRVARLS